MKDKEVTLTNLIANERKTNEEIKKKESLITSFKELLDQMNKEKELLNMENSKIRVQLNQIKDLFKERLP